MNSDREYYDSRAKDILTARGQGDITGAAEVAAQVLVEEGPDGVAALTEAIQRAQD
ncbi:hypothetical protein [Streptomyces sp. 35G-GA-8]|uniref:hypothetical protein n=1 Tax=Streptomyces sp. 35G-GA-8 TaxID=2939434 RepID=UPI00201EFDA1|nr:hypothetical protein [Streptomyces sp. 35G-GA-8]MCL7377461.1 hypothetical protein [Streptomyces sp. 35G-GA-8]